AIDRLAVAADRDEAQVAPAGRRPEPAGHLEAVDPREPQVDQRDREFARLRVLEAVLAADRDLHRVTVELEQQAEAPAGGLVVLDQEDPRRARHRRRRRAGQRDGRRTRRQPDDELAAVPFARAERLHRAAVELDQPADQGQAEPEAIGARVAGAAAAYEQ